MKRSQKIVILGEIYEQLAQESRYEYICFIDLCGSTNYKQKLIEAEVPSSAWLHRQLIFLQWSAEHFRKRRCGTVIKTIGDSLMLSFDFTESPETILSNCLELVSFFDSSRAFRDENAIQLKISLDFGETVNGDVIAGTYDPIGICVDRCARLNGLSSSHEIVLSTDFYRRFGKTTMEQIHNMHPLIQSVGKKCETIKGLGKTNYISILSHKSK
jgi:class 3 adenylate cyclase